MYASAGTPYSRITNPSMGATSAYVAVTSAVDVFRYSPPVPCQVLRWGFIATTTVNDGTNALKLTCDLRPTAGSDTGRLTGGTFTVAAASGYNASGSPAFYVDYGGTGTTLGLGGGSITNVASTTQVVAGKGIYHTLNPQAPTSSTVASGLITVLSGTYPAPDTANLPPGGVDTQFVVYPGQEVLIKVQATAPAAGAGIFWMDVIDLAFAGGTNNYENAASQIPSAMLPTPSNAISNLTRFFS